MPRQFQGRSVAESGGGQALGLSQDACSSKQACAWVEGYVRKDGVKVKDYCRSAGQKRTKTEASAGKSQG